MNIPDTNSPPPPDTNVAPPDDVFPIRADSALRDQIAGAFLSAHRGWNGNRPGVPMVQNPSDAQALAVIAVLLFRKSQL